MIGLFRGHKLPPFAHSRDTTTPARNCVAVGGGSGKWQVYYRG